MSDRTIENVIIVATLLAAAFLVGSEFGESREVPLRKIAEAERECLFHRGLDSVGIRSATCGDGTEIRF